MRYQGRIVDWREDRGFGFITPNGGGTRVFVHRSEIESRRRPRGGELVTYDLTVDAQRRHNANQVQYVSDARPRGPCGTIRS